MNKGIEPIQRNDSRLWARFLYFFNDFYNLIAICLMGNLDNKEIDEHTNFVFNENSLEGAKATQLTWLLNIDRSFEIIKYFEKDQKDPFNGMGWYEVGCGSGIVSIYVSCKYDIKTQYLFDFDKRCIDLALFNINRYNSSLLAKLFGLNTGRVFEADAAHYKLESKNKKNIIYMYNPFDEKVMEKFILNNLDSLKKGSYLIYINDIYKEFLISIIGKNIKDYKRNAFYQISVFKF